MTQPTQNKPPTILLCEDEEFVARSYTRKLELEGYEVIHKKNGQEVLTYLETNVPDLILLDLMMPLKSGFEVLTEIKQGTNAALKKIPVIVASNLGQQRDIDESLALGAVDFIVKSNMSLKDLSAMVAQHLSKK